MNTAASVPKSSGLRAGRPPFDLVTGAPGADLGAADPALGNPGHVPEDRAHSRGAGPGPLTEWCEGLLRALGGSWDRPPALADRWWETPRASRWIESAASLTRTQARPWRDPGLCLTMPAFLAATGRDVRVLVVVDAPHVAAANMAGEFGVGWAHALALWEEYMRRVTAALEGMAVTIRCTTSGWSPLAGPDGPPSEPVPEGVLDGQWQLWSELVARQGSVSSWERLAVPKRSPWTAELLGRPGTAQVRGDTGGQDVPLEQQWSALSAAVAAMGRLREHQAVALADKPTPPWERVSVVQGGDALGDPGRYRQWFHRRYGSPAPPSSAPVTDSSPMFSILVPVYRPERWYLARCVESVKAQTYPRWELCLCDDGSEDPELAAYLESLTDDPRVRVGFRQANGGISAATNDALAMARGEFVVLLDNDDELVEIALEYMADAIALHPQADVLYSDEDKLDAEGLPCQPTLKPSWSPELLASTAYTCHLTVLRRSLVNRIGGLRSEFDGSQDYDVTLRATELAEQVVHVPEVLYHWRIRHGSAADDPMAKPWAHDASRRALASALERRGEGGYVELGPQLGTYHVRRPLRRPLRASVVTQMRGNPRQLRRAVEVLLANPGHEDVELVVVDRSSRDLPAASLLERLERERGARVVHMDSDQGWSAAANAGAAAASGDVVVWVDSKVMAASDGWLRALLEHAQRDEVGAVGCRLLNPSRTVVHGGVVLGLRGVVGQIYNGLPLDHHGYLTGAVLTRNYSAVSGAAMAMRADVFEQLGGVDTELPDTLGDVDLCLRAGETGLWTAYTPLARLVLPPALDRYAGQGSETPYFVPRWKSLLERGDPFFNPNLSPLSSLCALRGEDEDDPWNRMPPNRPRQREWRTDRELPSRPKPPR